MTHLRLATAPLLAAVSLATLSISAGAHAAMPADARVIAAPDGAPVDFEVFLPLRDKAGLQKLLAEQQQPGSPAYHKWLTPAQFAARFGPTAASLANVKAALAAAGLTITATHSRSVHVVGTAVQAARALGTPLNQVTRTDGRSRMVAAKPIPAVVSLGQEKVTIAAFSRTSEMHTDSRRVATPIPDNRYSPVGAYYYNDMKQAYDYPSYQSKVSGGNRLDGTGISIAILMSGDISDKDLADYFTHENFTATTHLPTPTISRYPVDGGPPPFGEGGDAEVEASLDTQQSLGGAPGAAVTLVGIPDLYDSHILDGYVAIVEANKWDIVSSSFGGCELGYVPAYNAGVDETGVLVVYDEVFAQGNAEGITFIASSGDSDGKACPNVGYFYLEPGAHFVPSVEEPASDPNVTAVGGGNLFTTTPPSPQTTPPTLTSKYVAERGNGDPEIPYDVYGFGENVAGGMWGAGGGRSAVWEMPTWQNYTAFYGNAGTTRIVPDVGMQVGGCPGGISEPNCPVSRRSFVVTNYDGQRIGLIGTSVAAPEFAGALALAAEVAGGRVGNVDTFLWTQGYVQDDLGGASAAAVAQFFHKGQPSFDGVYSNTSTSGFDYVWGNGSPDIRRLFGLTQFAPAGNPQTASNP